MRLSRWRSAKAGERAIRLSRGSFNVIDFWIENRVMLELLTKEMQQKYLQASGVTKETERLRTKSH